MIHGVRLAKHSSTFHHHLTQQQSLTELMQLRQGNVPFSGVPNYRDVSMTDMAVCDISLQMCRQSLYNHENEILSKGMVFNTMSEIKLFL
jgi:hypothetical protein